MKNFALIFTTLALFVFLAATVKADTAQYGQYGQYGGGQPTANIVIDKMVATGAQTKGGQQTFVDNLSTSDSKYAPGDQVYFQVKVRNISDTTLTNVRVTDTLPAWLDAVEGPGEYDPDTRTISWTYGELQSGEERVEQVIGQVKPQSDLPADKGIICMDNISTVQADNAYDEDTAQFCVEKQVVGPKGEVPTETPKAGAPLLAIVGINILGLGAGFYLRKHS